MVKSKRAVEKALRRKGFVESDGHHRFFIYHTLGGKKSSVTTKTSHGSSSDDLDSWLLQKMASQCELQRNDFLRLIDCPLDQAGYEAILRSQGVLARGE